MRALKCTAGISQNVFLASGYQTTAKNAAIQDILQIETVTTVLVITVDMWHYFLYSASAAFICDNVT